MKTAGFIGCGHMGGALAAAAARAAGEEEILTADRHPEKLETLKNACGTIPASLSETASDCRYLFLGVKPQGMKALSMEIRETLSSRKEPFVLVSMAAGITLETLRSLFGVEKIIRILPNLPVSAGEGVILYAASAAVTAGEEEGFLTLMRSAGLSVKLEESKIDAGCAVTGCGPAFVCLWMEGMIDAGVRAGLPYQAAKEMTVRTFLGTAALLQKTGDDPAGLRTAVCSPAGSTIEGIAALEKSGARYGAMEAVTAAYLRNKELGKN